MILLRSLSWSLNDNYSETHSMKNLHSLFVTFPDPFSFTISQVDDLLAVQNCNLLNLPENYQMKYCNCPFPLHRQKKKKLSAEFHMLFITSFNLVNAEKINRRIYLSSFYFNFFFSLFYLGQIFIIRCHGLRYLTLQKIIKEKLWVMC